MHGRIRALVSLQVLDCPPDVTGHNRHISSPFEGPDENKAIRGTSAGCLLDCQAPGELSGVRVGLFTLGLGRSITDLASGYQHSLPDADQPSESADPPQENTAILAPATVPRCWALRDRHTLG